MLTGTLRTLRNYEHSSQLRAFEGKKSLVCFKVYVQPMDFQCYREEGFVMKVNVCV